MVAERIGRSLDVRLIRGGRTLGVTIIPVELT